VCVDVTIIVDSIVVIIAAFIAIKDDIVNAGGIWCDDKCVSDQRIVSAQVRIDDND
jgi:hypothetical protein